MKDTLLVTGASSERQNVGEAVVDAVADAKDVSSMDLRPPLYEAVDPDALDELVTSMSRMPDDSAGRITFQYSGYEVSISADGEISLAEDETQGPTVSRNTA